MSETASSSANGWSEWSRFVLKELERLNACHEKAYTEISELRRSTDAIAAALKFDNASIAAALKLDNANIAAALKLEHTTAITSLKDDCNKRIGKLVGEIDTLKVKSSLWGAAASVLTTIGVILLALLTGVIK
jgi:hypothetical protein